MPPAPRLDSLAALGAALSAELFAMKHSGTAVFAEFFRRLGRFEILRLRIHSFLTRSAIHTESAPLLNESAAVPTRPSAHRRSPLASLPSTSINLILNRIHLALFLNHYFTLKSLLYKEI
jgi:hypothetical protein